MALVMFADIFWLFARDPVQLKHMWAEWTKVLAEDGFGMSHSEASWGWTAPDEWKSEVIVDNHVIKRVPRKGGYKMLGCMLTFDGREHTELLHRTQKAWNSYFVYRNLLTAKGGSWKVKNKLLNQTAGKSFVWCSGSWNLKVQDLTRVRALQLKFQKRLLNLRKRETESAKVFVIRRHRIIKHLNVKHGIESWHATAHRQVFEWAGHIVRFQKYDPGRLTYKVLKFKDWSWLQRFAKQNRGRQGHGRNIHDWRWEKPLYALFKPHDWKEHAQNRDWAENINTKVHWRLRNRQNDSKHIIVVVCLWSW